MASKEVAIKFLRDKQKKLVKNFQADIFSLETTGDDEILSDLKVLEVLKSGLKDNIEIKENVLFIGHLSISMDYTKNTVCNYKCGTKRYKSN